MRRALALSLIVLPAAAAEPRLVPERDVTVVYEVTPGDQAPIDVQAEIAAGTTRARITGEGIPGTMLIDLGAHKGTLLIPPLRAYHTFNIGHAPFPPQDAKFTERGHEQIAGQSCTCYDVTLHRGGGSVCLTGDGVILAARGEDQDGHHGELRAKHLSYGAIPAETFQLPSDYRDIGSARLRFPDR